MRGRSALVLGAMGVALAVALVLPGAAGAVSHRVGRAGGGSIRSFWTPRRMAKAVPMPTPTAAPQPVGSEGPAPLEVGEPGSLAPQPPVDVTSTGATTWRPESSQVNHQTEYPQSANGRLFFVSGGDYYTCSATVVRSQTRSVILTAGHCAYFDGYWSKRIVFVPAFRGTKRPFGIWRARSEVILHAWYRGNWNYDYAAMSLRPNRRGRVGDVVGELGLTWNYPRDQYVRAIGYPINLGLGNFMWQCTSGIEGHDGAALSGPPAVAIDCNMRHGSSGGSWQIEGSDGPYVASVTSHSIRPAGHHTPGLLYGPYLTQKVAGTVKKVEALG